MVIREKFNALSHFFGSVFSIVGLFLLLSKSESLKQIVSALVFCLTMFAMFFSSALYHTLNAKDKVIKILRKIDHSMIALFIAGTYTPVCLLVLEGKTGKILLFTIWSLAIISVLQSVFWIDAPRWFSTGVYLLMGWVAVFGIKYVYNALSFKGFVWLVLGGLFYTVGAVIYTVKKPNFGNFLGFHELWHIFVLGGAFSHYIMVFRYVY